MNSGGRFLFRKGGKPSESRGLPSSPCRRPLPRYGMRQTEDVNVISGAVNHVAGVPIKGAKAADDHAVLVPWACREIGLECLAWRRDGKCACTVSQLNHSRGQVVRGCSDTTHLPIGVEFQAVPGAAAMPVGFSTRRVRRMRPSRVQLTTAPGGGGRSRRRRVFHFVTIATPQVPDVT